MPTKIEWTQSDDGEAGETWNVVRGCSRISPGCGGARGVGGCYAERQAIRQAAPGGAYEGLVRTGKQGPRWTGKVVLVPEKLNEPLFWRKPRRVFVNSMSDLFHEGLTNYEIAAVMGTVAACPQHTFQVLTKRSRRQREWFAWVKEEAKRAGVSPAIVCIEQACSHMAMLGRRGDGFSCSDLYRRSGAATDTWPLPNLWLGVSVESQEYADERIPDLLLCEAAVHFVSYEPALGSVRFRPWLEADKARLDWIIVGGESGPGARPFFVDWARSVVAECKEEGVACFVKQLGRRPRSQHAGAPDVPIHLVSRKGNDVDEWPLDLRVRQFPKSREPRAA